MARKNTLQIIDDEFVESLLIASYKNEPINKTKRKFNQLKRINKLKK